MAKVSTRTGLKVTVSTLLNEYATKRKATYDFLNTMPVIFDDCLPELNYIFIPQ